MSRSLLRRAIAAATALAVIVTLGACASGGSASSPIRVGWSGEVPPLDPAASDSLGSFAFLTQLYPSLLVVDADQADPVPEIAESVEWTEDGVYTAVLKSGLVFPNGHDLTTSDVKFSLERQLALQSEDGAWRRLANLDSIEIIDDTTIEFHLGTAIDTGFPFVLAGPAGLVLDEEAFFADELTPDADIIDAQAFGGPYVLESSSDEVLTLTPYLGFGGSPLAASTLELRAGDDGDLATRLSDGTVDVLAGRLGPETIQSLAGDDGIDMARAASGRVRLLAFDFGHMPFGSRTETPDAAKAAAVRTAISELVDREALADGLGANWVEPLYGYTADGIPGSSDVFSALHGDGEGGPDVDRATAALDAAAIPYPVELSIHVDLDQVGDPGRVEIDALAEQLDDSGLFTVTVVETDAEGFGSALVAGEVEAVFTSVLPVTADPRDYLEPFRSAGLLAPGYADAGVDKLLDEYASEPDADLRAAKLREIENAIAVQLPAIPLTQGVRVVFVRGTISGFGVDDSLPLDLSRLRR
ncbi:ABC transporter substrate-binding protein [Pseudolysinimonas yzui]|uniref:Peptide ABC transporter substrate-binding protein n=1 Tax=Pseudolysinimonas yzui TaxID=2708254 RepID=A0A8J3GNK2_9MICO|nr:ABC transporter substrate-binding protein [Pseudolysinimonas yzui]GHF07769.1 peptide ABC transporter substrate-binding protein [Pseudolysinimonas yzui]